MNLAAVVLRLGSVPLRFLDLIHALPVAYLLIGLVTRDAIPLLNLADQLIALPGDDVDVVAESASPVLPHLALELLPVSLHLIPIHARSPENERDAAQVAIRPSRSSRRRTPRECPWRSWPGPCAH